MRQELDRRTSVLHIIHSLKVGGAENVVLMYAKYYNRSEYRVEVCTFNPGGKLFDQVKKHNIKVHCLNSSSSHPASFYKLLHIFWSGQFEIIHFHNPLPVFWGLPAALISRVPVSVLTEHSINYRGRLGKASALYKILRRRIDLVLACSEGVRNSHLPDLLPRRLVTIHNGVDVEKFSPGTTDNSLRKELRIAKDHFIIGHVGNLTPQKGQIFLLGAIKKLLTEELPIVLVVAGDGPLRGPLESMTKELGISESVRFLGQRRDLPEILRSVDVLAGASLREGLPISVLEAMASGKPVVTTNVGGNKEAVLHGVTGFIVPPENSDELALALKKILLDDNLRQRMGDAARQRVEEHFSAQQMVKRTEEIYEKLLRSKQSG